MTGLTQAVVDAIMLALRSLFTPIEVLIETFGPPLLEAIVGTPHPDRLFGRPENGPWPELYRYYWDAIVPLSLSLYGLAVGLVILLESMSNLFSGYHATRLKRRAFVGLLGVLSWWWLAALSLRLVSAIAIATLPDLSDVSLFQTVSFTGIGLIGLVISLSVDLALFILLALIYLLRQLVLHLYVLLMPLLIVCWVPGLGPFALVSQFAKRLAGLYVPFLLMTLPVAVLFRLGEILGGSLSLSLGGIGAWLTALVIPVLAVLAPFVMVWQAGALFFMLDRTGRQVSTSTARRRFDSISNATSAGVQPAAGPLHSHPRGLRSFDQAPGGTSTSGRPLQADPISSTATRGSLNRDFRSGDVESPNHPSGSPLDATDWQNGADLLNSKAEERSSQTTPMTRDLTNSSDSTASPSPDRRKDDGTSK